MLIQTFLFHVAIDTLGKDHALPVLCRGAMMSKEDIEGALEQLQGANLCCFRCLTL